MKKTLSILIIVSMVLIPGCFGDVTAPAHVVITDQPISVTSPAPTPSDYFLEAARGNINGAKTINKFGRNLEIDNGIIADIWDGGHTGNVSLIWVAPTADAIHNIRSTSASDTAVGGGARTIRIFGLNDWNTSEISEIITMNAGTDVPTVNDYVIIYRAEVLTKGATSSNVGTITITAAAPSAVTVTAQILPGAGQTHMAIIGIPSNERFYVGRYYADINKGTGAAGVVDFALLWNPEPQTELTNFLSKHTFGLQTTGTSVNTISYYTPKTFNGPGILKVQGLSGSNDIDVSAGFDGIMILN